MANEKVLEGLQTFVTDLAQLDLIECIGKQNWLLQQL